MRVLGARNTSFQEKLESQPVKPSKPALSSFVYLRISDGSCTSSLQVVMESSIAPLSQVTPTGTSIFAEGVLKQPSVQGKHKIELEVEKILYTGSVDSASYQLARKKMPINILRGYSHLRPRTTTVASITRIRSTLSHSTHTFFQNHEFLYVHMPVITTTDAKGFSEKFQVTTIYGEAVVEEELKVTDDKEVVNLEVVKGAIREKSKRIEELKRSDSNKEALFTALQDLKKSNELALQLETREKSNPRTILKAENVDFSKDFFSCQTYLTISCQLHLESYACALGNVYTFGPIFRAEKSQPLAELWMVEIEMAFSELEDVINCAEDYLKFLCQWVIEHCSEDIDFLSKRLMDKSSLDRLNTLASKSFEKIAYTKAVEILEKVTNKQFIQKIEWGIPLTEEHESYLADEVYKKPVIVYNYPKEVQPFYMRLNDDGRTVAAISVTLPKAGTVIRGGQREERIEELSSRMKELGLPREQYEWYLDLRRHGSVKHSGFSLAFDHLVLFVTGLTDIKDVIPFPRSYGNVKN